MTPQEHYVEAERRLEAVTRQPTMNAAQAQYEVALAQVHATLATVVTPVQFAMHGPGAQR